MDRNVDAIAAAYIRTARGDCKEALRLAIADALAVLLEAERRSLRAARLISHGYARGDFGLERPRKQRSHLIVPDDSAEASPGR